MKYLTWEYHTVNAAPPLTQKEWDNFMADDDAYIKERTVAGVRLEGYWICSGSNMRLGNAIIEADSHEAAWEYARNYPGTLMGCGNHWEIIPLFDNDYCFERAIALAKEDQESGKDKMKVIGI